MPTLKRTRTGLWTARKEIPADVRGIIGKREDKPTWPAILTQAEARAEFGAWLSNLEGRIEAARRLKTDPPSRLTHRRILELVAAWYRAHVDEFEDDPGSALGWEEWLQPLKDADELGRTSDKVEGEAGALLAAAGLKVTDDTRAALVEQLGAAFVALAALMERRAAGDYGPDPYAERLPEAAAGPANRKETQTPAGAALKITGLFASYAAERKPAPSTVKAWTRMIDRLVEFLKHDDARKVTPADFVKWKVHLLAEGKSAKTVGETYLAAARAAFTFAVENHLLPSNPAGALKVRGPKRQRLRSPDFTDKEADTILQAAFNTSPTSPGGLAKRWVPWLCAYTGARVGEITQLRRLDVYEEDGIWLMRITPEAGSTKTGEARIVPLHDHLIEQGFADMVEGRAAGPVFYNPDKGRKGSEGNPQHKKVGERLAAWVREIGVDDPAVQPNHGWRHRFKTVARTAAEAVLGRGLIMS